MTATVQLADANSFTYTSSIEIFGAHKDPFDASTISTWRSHFPRNEPSNPAKYLSERPEMTTQ
jgi:hypothetical protein